MPTGEHRRNADEARVQASGSDSGEDARRDERRAHSDGEELHGEDTERVYRH